MSVLFEETAGTWDTFKGFKMRNFQGMIKIQAHYDDHEGQS